MFNWFNFVHEEMLGHKGKHAGEIKASRSPEMQARLKKNAEAKRERRRQRNLMLVASGGMKMKEA